MRDVVYPNFKNRVQQGQSPDTIFKSMVRDAAAADQRKDQLDLMSNLSDQYNNHVNASHPNARNVKLAIEILDHLWQKMHDTGDRDPRTHVPRIVLEFASGLVEMSLKDLLVMVHVPAGPDDEEPAYYDGNIISNVMKAPESMKDPATLTATPADLLEVFAEEGPEFVVNRLRTAIKIIKDHTFGWPQPGGTDIELSQDWFDKNADFATGEELAGNRKRVYWAHTHTNTQDKFDHSSLEYWLAAFPAPIGTSPIVTCFITNKHFVAVRFEPLTSTIRTWNSWEPRSAIGGYAEEITMTIAELLSYHPQCTWPKD